LAALEVNAPEFGIRLIGDADREQGIVHVVGPEQGFLCPARRLFAATRIRPATVVWARWPGIGTSEVEHVLATQTLQLKRSKTMEVRVEGELGAGVTAKDLVLHICGTLGASGGTGYVIEYTGSAIRGLSIEGRLTVSNMAIEHGARAPDCAR
jgi:3-isopropylmalate/(R)-2-methylmalate dehydratase large subunit